MLGDAASDDESFSLRRRLWPSRLCSLAFAAFQVPIQIVFQLSLAALRALNLSGACLISLAPIGRFKSFENYFLAPLVATGP